MTIFIISTTSIYLKKNKIIKRLGKLFMDMKSIFLLDKLFAVNTLIIIEYPVLWLFVTINRLKITIITLVLLLFIF